MRRKQKISPSLIIVKIMIIAIVITIINITDQVVSPIIANELALIQMENREDSSLWIQLYSNISNYVWVAIVILVIFLFLRELKYIFNFIKSKFKEDKNHEN